jgi:hypothetical protein
MADALPLPSPNRRKIIFVAIDSHWTLPAILIVILMLSGVGKKDSAKGFKPETKEVSLWTVNMAPAIFEELNKGFNNYVERRDMKLVVRNF